MTPIKLITVTSHPEHATVLIESAKRHGWDIEVIESNPWKGFGSKLIETYNYLKAHPEVERFVFADAFDVVVMGTVEEFERKFPAEINMLVSTEKGLWPPVLHPFRKYYSDYQHGFNFPNSGLYYAESWYFKYLMEEYPPSYETDDQYWMNICSFLENSIERDELQSIFNSHSFIREGEYTYHSDAKRIEIMGNLPIFVHKNGKTVDEKLNQMLNQ